MKNILNVSKISLKPILMGFAILSVGGVNVHHSFEKSVEASHYTSEKKKNDVLSDTVNPSNTSSFDDLDGNGGKKFSCGDCVATSWKKISSSLFSSNKENSGAEIVEESNNKENTDVEIFEEEEEDKEPDDVPNVEVNYLNNDGVTHRTPSSQTLDD